MKDKIIQYIKSDISNENLEEIDVQEDLLGSGIIDSMGMMKLIAFIEKEAKIKIPAEAMTIENFMTLENMMGYISSQTNANLDEK